MTDTGSQEKDASSADLERRLADFAMVLDLLGTLPGAMSEEVAIGAIFDLFTALCAPSSIVYLPVIDGRPQAPLCRPEDCPVSPKLHAFLTGEDFGYTPNSSGRGFLVRLRHAGETLGGLEIDGVAFPQYLSHYLQLALTIAQVCALGVRNGRIYQQLRASIREREEAERKVTALNEQLRERIEQVESVNRELDTFVYSVSHDLRAPLRAMQGFSQALVEDFGETLSPEAGEYLGQIALAGRNMGELIEGLLKLSRSTRGEMEFDAVDLSGLAERILGGLAANEPARRVSWTVAPGLSVRGDARMLAVVVENLLGNAWKYSAGREDAVIEFGEMAKGECAGTCRMSVFFVRDNGAGFDMRYSDRLFQPFQRLHRQEEFPGIGIGLATVKRIIERHGGIVRGSAAPGRGAVFSFSLPLSKGLGEHQP
ncbi:MAG: sensor histidine kinase [Syntrophobacteraceae bacterium]